MTVSGSRARLTPQLSIEPNLSLNWVDLVQGSFKTELVGSRVVYSVTPLMFVSTLVQYRTDNHVANANVRLRWEYQPGSELIVVYNHERDLENSRPAGFENRALVIKVNRLFRF